MTRALLRNWVFLLLTQVLHAKENPPIDYLGCKPPPAKSAVIFAEGVIYSLLFNREIDCNAKEVFGCSGFFYAQGPEGDAL